MGEFGYATFFIYLTRRTSIRCIGDLYKRWDDAICSCQSWWSGAGREHSEYRNFRFLFLLLDSHSGVISLLLLFFFFFGMNERVVEGFAGSLEFSTI